MCRELWLPVGYLLPGVYGSSKGKQPVFSRDPTDLLRPSISPQVTCFFLTPSINRYCCHRSNPLHDQLLSDQTTPHLSSDTAAAFKSQPNPHQLESQPPLVLKLALEATPCKYRLELPTHFPLLTVSSLWLRVPVTNFPEHLRGPCQRAAQDAGEEAHPSLPG